MRRLTAPPGTLLFIRTTRVPQVHVVPSPAPRAHAHLNPVAFIGDVDLPALNVSVDLLRRVYERLLHVVRRLGRRFHEDQTVFVGECLPLLGAHGAAMLQIVLVANEHNDHVGLGVLTGLLQPPPQVLEGVPPGDVVDKESPGGAAVV